MRGNDWETWLRRTPPEREDKWGGNAGDFDGGCHVRRMPLKEKKSGGGQARGNGGKVAKIEFFDVGNYAGNGHLSADKVTKCSYKVFVLKKTLTRLDTV